LSAAALPVSVLDFYNLADSARVAPGGGTAGSTWRIESPSGAFFIRRRGVRTSAPRRIAYDHGLRRHLAERHYPTAAPLEGRDGATWIAAEGAVYEAYSFVAGHTVRADEVPRVRAAAGRALGLLHRLALDYAAPCEPLVPQYTTYPCGIAPRARFDDPEAQLEAVDFLIAQYATEANRADMQRARECVARAGAAFARLYPELGRGVVHGDYNCYNLLFDDAGEVAGVFDLDWAWREARLFDVARGAVFFGCAREGESDTASIWSLTRAPRHDALGIAAFVAAYDESVSQPLTATERRALPEAILAQWASWRIEGAMKVPEDRRAEFFLYTFFEPYGWFSR